MGYGHFNGHASIYAYITVGVYARVFVGYRGKE